MTAGEDTVKRHAQAAQHHNMLPSYDACTRPNRLTGGDALWGFVSLANLRLLRALLYACGDQFTWCDRARNLHTV